jgi:hypothetical protein
MKFLVFFMLSATLLSGCNEPRVVKISAEYNDQFTAQQIEPTGNNTIKGSALIRQSGGGIVTCAGNKVDIAPVTTYSSERVQAIYMSNNEIAYAPIDRVLNTKIVPDPPLEYKQRARQTTCDAQGFFKFENVRDGLYFISTMVVWNVGYIQNGGALIYKVNVKGGEIKEVVLSP